MKKLRSTRSSHASFADVLDVIFAPPRGLWRYFDIKSALALARVCRAARETLRTWLDAVVRDISLGKEALPVPVQLSASHLDVQLRAVVELVMAFVYTTSVHVPVHAALPRDLLSKQQRDDRCHRILRGRQVDVVIAPCKGKGWGALAAQPIERGAYVGEYTGELISSGEMRRRYRERYDRERRNYVLSLREHVARSALRFDVVCTNVDASSSGSLTRLFNHSCSPSLEVAAVRVDSFVPRLALFARRRIDAGEELTFDYGDGSSAMSQRAEAEPCHCGAPECRGYLPS